MNWLPLTSIEQLENIAILSSQKPQLIFKHSTRCSISMVVKSRLEKSTAPEHIDFYYLDLLSYRDISNQIASRFEVHHESPQVLLIVNGECIYDESQMGIRMDDIVEQSEM
jgi:bacillithiol system protein YtxJ